MSAILEKLLSIGEAAHYLGVSIDTLRNWDKQKKLIPQKTAKGTRQYPLSVLEKILQERGGSINHQETDKLATANEHLLIGDAAKYLGISIDTLRNWETQNKIFPQRTTGGQRKYLVSDLDNLKKTNIYLINKESRPFIAEDFIQSLTTDEEPKLNLNQLDVTEETEILIDDYIKPDINTIKKFITRVPLPVFIISGTTSLLIFLLFAAFTFTPLKQNLISLFPTGSKSNLSMKAGVNINPDVLAATFTNYYLDFDSDVVIRGDLAVGGSINKVNLIPAGDNNVKNLTVSTPTITLDQDLSTTSSPTFAGLTVLSPINAPSLSTGNEILFKSTGTATGTLSWAPTSAVTLTLPNITDTLVTKTSTDTLSNKTINSGDGNTISGSFTGITGLGTITTGTWNGTKIGTTYGGTGITSYTTGDLLYGSASNTLSTLGIGSSGQVLTVTSGLPAWTASSSILTSVASNILPATTNTYDIGSVTNEWRNGYFAGTLTVAGNIVGASTGTSGYWTRDNTAGTLYAATTADKVGIGTTAPGSQLEVKANSTNSALVLKAASSGTANIFDVMNNAGTTSYFSVDSTGSLSGSAFRITDQANAIVGTAIPGGWTLGSFTYTYRRPVSITATGNLPINYEINVNINNTTTAGKIFNSTEQVTPWRDFRMAYTTDGVNFTEIRRNITTYTSTNIVYSFQLNAQILSGATSSTNYYIYYSSPNLSSMTQTAADLTYTGTLLLDSADTESATGWTSGDSAYVLSTASTPAAQAGSFSVKTTAMVDRMATFSTASQGQLATGLTDIAAITDTIGASTYVYAVGGNTGAADVSTVYKSTITSNNLSSFTTTTFQLPQTISGAALATATALNTGTGALGALDLSLASGTGCSGTGLTLSGTFPTWTCTIDVSTSQQTFNFTNINIPSGTTLTINGPYTTANNTRFVPILKATGTVTVGGTINVPALGYSGGTTGHRTGYGPGGGNTASSAGSGGGYGGTGGGGIPAVAGGSTYTTQEVGSGGGFSGGGLVNGGNGGGGVEIDSTGDMTINTINANGANGGNNSNGGGGGGSGGRVTLRSFGQITITGSVTANGGDGGQASIGSGCDGGGGGGGRVTLQDSDGIITGATANGGTSRRLGCDAVGAERVGQAGPVTQSTVPAIFYVIGGKHGSTYLSTVYMATLNTTGDTAADFTTSGQTQLPQALAEHTTYSKMIGTTNYVYVIGGNNGISDVDTVYKGSVDLNGNITSWTTTGQGVLPQTLSQHAQTSITIGGTTYLYILGGKNTGVTQSTIYKSAINSSTGDVGAFSSTSILPVALYDAQAVTATVGSLNYLFVIGGNNGTSNVSTVYRAPIDGSGNIGDFSIVGQAQLPVSLSGHQTLSNLDGVTPYYYTLGGTTGSTVSTAYKSTLTSDMTNFYIYKQISATGYDLSNKNDLTFSFYSTDNAASLEQVAFSESASPTFTSDTGWSTSTFAAAQINTWEPIDWDISAIGSRTSVKWLRFKVNTPRTLTFDTYFDNLKIQTSASASTNTNTANPATLGAANLTLNAQGTGIVRANYSDNSSSTFPNLAGSGGFAVYDGSQDCSDGSHAVSCLLFSVGSTGNITGTGNATFTGSVGIGTTVPLSKLGVLGNASIGATYGNVAAPTSGLIVEGNVGIGTTNPGSKIQVNGNAVIGYSAAIAAPTNGLLIGGNVGIGTTAPLSGLGILSNASIGATYGNVAAPTSSLIVESKVGIGTTNPSNALEVVGNTSTTLGILAKGIYSGAYTDGIVADYTTGQGRISVGPADGIGFYNGGVANTPLMTILSNGNVGIGTTLPGSKLSINGGISAGAYSAVTAPANGMIISGNVGIGTTNPVHNIDVVGDAGLSTGTLWTNTSDARVKLNIETIPDALGLVNQLKPSQYMYTPEYLARHPEIKNVEHYGFIAQDFQKLFPESISTGPDGYMQVNASNVIPYMAKAIQELSNKVNSYNLTFDANGNVVLPKVKIDQLVLSSDISVNGPSQNYFDVAAKIAEQNEAIATQTNELAETQKQVDVLSAAVSSASAGLASTSADLASTREQVSSTSADLAELKSSIEGLKLTPPEILLSTESAKLVNLTVASEATVSGQLVAYQAVISDTFKSFGETFLGNTMIAGDLTQDGTLSLTKGNSIDAIGTLYLQSSPLAQKLDIFNGLVVIDNMGNIRSQSITTDKVTAGTAIVGSSIILPWQSEVVIPSTALTINSKVFLTATSNLDGNLIASQIAQGLGFKVKITRLNSTPVTFNWWIVDSK